MSGGVELTGENALTANEARALGAFADAFVALGAGNDDLALHAAVPHIRSAASKLRAALSQPSSNEEKLREALEGLARRVLRLDDRARLSIGVTRSALDAAVHGAKFADELGSDALARAARSLREETP